MRRLIFFSSVVSVLCLQQCGDLSRETKVVFPSLPPLLMEQFPGHDWIVKWCDRSGELVERVVPGTYECCYVPLPRYENQAVEAEPLIRGYPGWVLSCGGIYPQDCGGRGELHLGWQHGFTASLFLTLQTQGISMTGFNVKRFRKEVLEKAEGNPWSIEMVPLLEDFVSGCFSFHSIKRKQICRAGGLPEGEWISWNPLRNELIEITADPVPFTAGYHRFYQGDRILCLTVDEKHPPEWMLID
jgi:hypothetical protein